MIEQVSLPLPLDEGHKARLCELQNAFVEACNLIAGVVVVNHCWNRVALHHLVYNEIRNKLPKLGSQMVSNAIYTVSRASRKVYQDPGSQWKINSASPVRLPRLKFLPNHPVFFDRHTLSVKDKMISLFSLDGRLQFQASIPATLRQKLEQQKLRDIAMQLIDDSCVLHFHFRIEDATQDQDGEDPSHLLNSPATAVIPVEPTRP